MKLARWLVLAALLGAGGWIGWKTFFPPDEVVIRRRLEALAKALSSTGGEGNFARVAAVNKAVSFFAPQVVINTEGMAGAGDVIQGRQDLQQALFAARARMSGGVTFPDIQVGIRGAGKEAAVHLTAVARLAGQSDPYVLELLLAFEKLEGDWLITQVDRVRTPQLEHSTDAP